MELSIVIPVYNEEKRLDSSLLKIISYCQKHFTKYEIIVVDDGSKDSTPNIALQYKDKNVRLIQNGKNMGKGIAVKVGVINAMYDLILFTDSDLSTPIEETQKFLKFLNDGFDVVIGSRSLPESNITVHQPAYRQILGKAFPLIVRCLVLPDFKDTQCGFKLFTKKAALAIFPRQTVRRFAFDVEILFIAKKLGFKIKEAPVTWVDQEGSKVSPIKDSIRMFREIVKIRYNNIKGEYN